MIKMNYKDLRELVRYKNGVYYHIWGNGNECTNDVLEGTIYPLVGGNVSIFNEAEIVKLIENILEEGVVNANGYVTQINIPLEYGMIIKSDGVSEDGTKVDENKIVKDLVTLSIYSYQVEQDGKIILKASKEFVKDNEEKRYVVHYNALQKALADRGFGIAVTFDTLKRNMLESGRNQIILRVQFTPEYDYSNKLNKVKEG